MAIEKTKMTSLDLDWAHHPNALGLQVRKTIIGMKPAMKNGKPEMHIHISLVGQLQEINVPLDVMDLKEMARIEKAYEKMWSSKLTMAFAICNTTNVMCSASGK